MQKSCLKDDTTPSQISDSNTASVNDSPKPQKLPEEVFTAEAYLNCVSGKCQAHGASSLLREEEFFVSAACNRIFLPCH